MKKITFETAQKINAIIKERGLSTSQVIQRLEKIDGYVSFDFFNSLKFDFSNQAIEIRMAVLNFYQWMHRNDFKNDAWFTPAYSNDMVKKVNSIIGIN